ncbi:hypothetical protein HJC23_006109 [Cyclotella cryptica]|uniref:Serine aminopeptidase S33 domain-containing protein n=1 Tax=Cyclotella cryptica TaxID=29204 RepID=A0ABD3QKK5_9STRA|eukprot:CCRYP_004568-RA/>CCRYP_004568-RA protein AED:0.42 eAED:0.42 QI:317/1/1/1/1/1/3/83/346
MKHLGKMFHRLFLIAIMIASGLATNGTASVPDNCTPSEGSSCQAYTVLGRPEEFTTSSTGVKLAVRRWIPEEIKSVVVFHHGAAGWHTGCSEIMGNALRNAGIAVIAYDTVGSGYSDALQGGMRNYFDSIDTLTADFTKILRDVRSEYPEKKVFALGESFGCMVLLTQILQEQENGKEDGSLADGYIFSGPVVKVLPEMLPPKPVIKVLNFVSRFFPLLKMPGTDFFSTFDLAFGDKGWAQAGRNDPMIQEAATIPPRLGMAASILTNMDKMYDSLGDIRVPFKIFLGENESRVDVSAVKHLARVAKSTDKEIEIVEGGFHQLFQDRANVTAFVCDCIAAWISARS